MTETTIKQMLKHLRRIDWLAAAIRSNTPTPMLEVPRLKAEQISILAHQVVALIEHDNQQTNERNHR